MYCPSCGFENIDGEDFCSECNESLTSVQPRPTRKSGMERLLESETLAALQPARPVCVDPTTKMSDALRLLSEKDIGCVLVTWCDALVGIFSERDALMKVGTRYREVANEPVRHFMTPAPETLEGDESIAFAVNRMAVGDFRHVPIEEDEKPVGIISVRDILKYVAEQFPEILTQKQ